MPPDDFREVEVKFLVSDLPTMQDRLKNAGAKLLHPRIHELNLRFDTPQQTLTSTFQVLRLRQDQKITLTYKGPSDPDSDVSSRPEIEIEVNSLSSARSLLQALGYQVMITYEKYRTTYCLNQAEIVLDEMPYGNFVEIEAPDQKTIEGIAKRLGLNWEHKIKMSYLLIFNVLKERFKLTAHDLLFEQLKGQVFSIHELFHEGLDG